MNEWLAKLDPAIVILVSAFLPLLQAVINGTRWSKQVKAIVAFAVAIAVGVGVAWVQDTFDREGITYTCAAVYVLSQVAFGSFWKPTGVADEIERNVLPRDGGPA